MSAVGIGRAVGDSRPSGGAADRVLVAVATLARVVLGVLWVNEGILKWHAGFGRADILLVVQSAGQNPRVPDFFRAASEASLGQAPGLFGVAVPIVEVGLGLVLILGILPRIAAVVAALQLASYWLADQLIAQYPIMAALATVVAVTGVASSRWSLPAVVRAARRRRATAAA